MPETTLESSAAPWEGRRSASARGILRKIITWTLGLGLLSLIGYGLRPRPAEIETGVVVRGPLTVHVVEEGKTRIRNRFVISAPVAGQMRRVPFKNGDKVITNGGLFGTIVGIEGDSIQLRIADQVKVKVLRSAVASLQPEGKEE